MLAGLEAIQSFTAHTPNGQAPLGGADMSRVLQGLMGGVGFLGAGAVIQNKKAVRGLTTAAAVWVTALRTRLRSTWARRSGSASSVPSSSLTW